MINMEIGTFWEFFDVKHHKDGTLKMKMCGQGTDKNKPVIAFIEKNEEAIDKASISCGYIVIISNEDLIAMQAAQSIDNRDGVEKNAPYSEEFTQHYNIGVHFNHLCKPKSDLICSLHSACFHI